MISQMTFRSEPAMNTSLYVLSHDYQAVASRLTDLELDEQTIMDTLEGISGELEAKAKNVGMFVRNLEVAAESIKKAESDMAARRKALESRAARVRAYLKENMERAGISTISGEYFTLALKKNPPAVVIDAQGQIPEEYMKQPEIPPLAPDKKAIAEAIKSGKEVPGAHLSSSTRLDIK